MVFWALLCLTPGGQAGEMVRKNENNRPPKCVKLFRKAKPNYVVTSCTYPTLESIAKANSHLNMSKVFAYRV